MKNFIPMLILFAIVLLFACAPYQQSIDQPGKLHITDIPLTRISTNTITPTLTREPTQTVTPTPIPTPRIWSSEILEKFMLPGNYPVKNFLRFGWNDYDGVEFLDDYPCYLVCPMSMSLEEEENIIKMFIMKILVIFMIVVNH